MDFKYTTMSLNDVYKIGTKHAMEMLEKNGAKINGENIEIQFQEIKPVALEIGFEGHYPVSRGTTERFTMPSNFSKRRREIAWKYQLSDGPHKVKISLLNAKPGFSVQSGDLIVYSSSKVEKAQ